MEPATISRSLTAAEVMQRWPVTIPIFIQHGLACVGCPFAPFETLAEILAIYGPRIDDFIRELQHTIGATGEPIAITQ